MAQTQSAYEIMTQAHHRMKHFTLISINWQLPTVWPVNQTIQYKMWCVLDALH